MLCFVINVYIILNGFEELFGMVVIVVTHSFYKYYLIMNFSISDDDDDACSELAIIYGQIYQINSKINIVTYMANSKWWSNKLIYIYLRWLDCFLLFAFPPSKFFHFWNGRHEYCFEWRMDVGSNRNVFQ